MDPKATAFTLGFASGQRGSSSGGGTASTTNSSSGGSADAHAMFYGTPSLPPAGGTTLFIIDPQKDFHPGGSLAIGSADEDAARIANLIKTHGSKITDIVVSLDTHERFHIAHPSFWHSGDGKKANPAPFTIITAADVQTGKWVTSNAALQQWGLEYCTELEKQGRFQLCIWPEHCLIGTSGHNVVDSINDALQEWAMGGTSGNPRAICYVIKGNHVLTENYSSMKADVPVPGDPRTLYNERLLSRLLQSDRILLCGQAKSHCVNFTARDLAARWPKDRMAQLVVLDDCQSPVPSFEKQGDEFIADMNSLGVTVLPKVADLTWP